MQTTATTGNRHPRRSAEQWRAIIQHFESSDLSQVDFCRQEGLSLTSFSRWLGRFRCDDHQPGFVELHPEPSPSTTPTAVPSCGDWTLEIDLPGGGSLRLSRSR